MRKGQPDVHRKFREKNIRSSYIIKYGVSGDCFRGRCGNCGSIHCQCDCHSKALQQRAKGLRTLPKPGDPDYGPQTKS